MSIVVKNSAPTIQERSITATKRLTSTLGLDDLKLLATALAEVAADEAQANSSFAQRIRDVYGELQALKGAGRVKTPRSVKEPVKLVPITQIDERIDTHGPLDPYFLLRLYGADQLRLALDGYSLAKLKEGMAAVEVRNSGTKPKSKASKAALIDYIVEQVAGPGH